MLDMDGTILDLAFDNYMWLEHVPENFAEVRGIAPDEARRQLYAKFEEMLGRLEWYCLDHWSDYLDLDVAGMHRDQNHRIGYLPGAEQFLKAVSRDDLRVVLVTNSPMEVLNIKDEVTGLTEYFDAVYSSHSFGAPKESQDFWHALRKEEDFDPETTLFVDDTPRVLDSANTYGVSGLLEIRFPDTSKPARTLSDFPGVDGVADLLEPGTGG